MDRLTALRILHENLPELRARGIVDLWLFGSVARNEARPDSDVDLLVDVKDGVSLLCLGAIKVDLEERLGARVDLGTRRSLKDGLREYVEKDMVHVA